MKIKEVYVILFVLSIFLLASCKTFEDKSQSIIKKENEKLEKFLQKSESELKIVMGQPNKIIYNDKGVKFFIYTI